MNKNLGETVRALNKRGFQVIPRDGDTKLPGIKWKKYHEEGYKNTEQEVEKWIQEGYEGFCLLTGDTSNGLEILDFDTLSDKSNVFELFQYVAGDLIKDCPTVKSGGGGVHVYYRRVTTTKSTKLAYKFDEGKKIENDKVMVTPELKKKRKVRDDFSIVIETRCNKAYVVCPYSMHKSGKQYQPSVENIVDFIDSIPLLDDETVEKIHKIARTFNELYNVVTDEDNEAGVVATKPQIERKQYVVDSNSPIDVYNSKVNIDWLLEKYGYKYHSQRDNNSLYYCRPGRDTIGVIVHVDQNKSWHFSDNDELYCTYNPMSPFDVFCHFRFNGDKKAAVKFLASHYGIAKTKPVVHVEAKINDNSWIKKAKRLEDCSQQGVS